MENKKKAADFGGGQQPEKNRSQIDNVPLTEGEVKYFEGLILKEMYRRDYAITNEGDLMKLSIEEKELIFEKRRKDAERKCPEIPRDVLEDIILKAEMSPAMRDGGLSMKRSIARQAAVWGFMQRGE